MTRFFSRAERWRLGLIGGVWALDLALLPFAPFRVVWSSFLPVALWVGVLALIAVVYTRWRPAPRLATAARATAEVLVFVLGAAILNYLGFMAGRPLYDADLVAADQVLGFDWLGFVSWLASIPHLNGVLFLAYSSSLVQVAAIVAFLALSGRTGRLDWFVLSFMASALITIAVWVGFPSYGAYFYYFGLDRPIPGAGLAVDPSYARTLIAMHGGSFPPLRFDNVVGLIGFPSFHTCLAVLCGVALIGVRGLGPVAIAVNGLVLFSVPAQGGHHLVDVFGGIVTVLLAMWLARRMRGTILDAAPRPISAHPWPGDMKLTPSRLD